MPRLKVSETEQKNINIRSILRYHMEQRGIKSQKKAGTLSGIGVNVFGDRFTSPEKLRIEELRKLKAYFHLSDEEILRMI